MLEIIGWLACGIALAWFSILVYFITIPTFGEAMFTGRLWQRVLGICLWAVVVGGWLLWLSVIKIDL